MIHWLAWRLELTLGLFTVIVQRLLELTIRTQRENEMCWAKIQPKFQYKIEKIASMEFHVESFREDVDGADLLHRY